MKIILKIINIIFYKRKKNFYYLIDNKKKIKKFIKKNKFSKNYSVILINLKKISILESIYIYFQIILKYEIFKNFLIFFDLKKEIIAQNVIPDWPNYKSSNIKKNLFFWIKRFSLNFFYYKNINFIAIKIK